MYRTHSVSTWRTNEVPTMTPDLSALSSGVATGKVLFHPEECRLLFQVFRYGRGRVGRCTMWYLTYPTAWVLPAPLLCRLWSGIHLGGQHLPGTHSLWDPSEIMSMVNIIIKNCSLKFRYSELFHQQVSLTLWRATPMHVGYNGRRCIRQSMRMSLWISRYCRWICALWLHIRCMSSFNCIQQFTCIHLHSPAFNNSWHGKCGRIPEWFWFIYFCTMTFGGLCLHQFMVDLIDPFSLHSTWKFKHALWSLGYWPWQSMTDWSGT